MLIVKYLWNLTLIVEYLWNLMVVFVSEGATKQHHQPLWTWKPAWTIQTGNRIDKTKKIKFHFNISWERNCPNVSYLWILSHVCPGPRPNRGPNLDHNAPAPWRARQRDRAGAHRQQHRTGGWQPCQGRHDQHLFFVVEQARIDEETLRNEIRFHRPSGHVSVTIVWDILKGLFCHWT